MATIKYPISLNDNDQAAIKELVSLMGQNNAYGSDAKAIRFGIRLALGAIQNPNKVYSGLDDENLKFYLSSILNSEIRQRKQAQAQKISQDAQKGITLDSPKV